MLRTTDRPYCMNVTITFNLTDTVEDYALKTVHGAQKHQNVKVINIKEKVINMK